MTQEEALQILKTGASVFLTGEPGSGKSYVASSFVCYLRRESVPVSVTASTGIAAAQLGGMTIHAWSGIGTRSRLTPAELEAIRKKRRVADRIKKARTLIIDEVSMLSGPTLLAVSEVCQYIRNSREAFGGLQIVFVGDFFQLPPVMRREEMEAEAESQDAEGRSPFAYTSRAWKDLDPKVCYLTEQHRQKDPQFSRLLAAIRSNRCGEADLELLSGRRVGVGDMPRNTTRLFTHNADVDRINDVELQKLKGETKTFLMTLRGDPILAEGLKRGCLSPERLELKPGAIVMFTKNDPEGRFVNGTLGVVSHFDREDGYPIVVTRNGPAVAARPAEWRVTDDDAVIASITQVPLRLAWAITVHKSQGMSLDAAVIDLSHAFEYGQGYVALSRVRSLAGLYLLGWNWRALRVNPEALAKDESFRSASEAECGRLSITESSKIEALHSAFIEDAKASASGTEKAASSIGSNSRIGNAYKKWTAQEDAEVSARYRRGESIKAIAAVLGRQDGGVRARLVKLGFIQE